MNAISRAPVTRLPRRFPRASAIHALLVAAFLALFGGSSSAFEKELATLSVRLTNKIVTSGIKKVAVLDFADLRGAVTELGRFLAEELTTQLVTGDRGLAVLDRTNLHYILKENNLSVRGLSNPKNAKKLGRYAGVDAILVGTITPIGERVRVTVKAIDIETTTIVAASTTYLAMTQTIKDLLEREVRGAGRPGGPTKQRARMAASANAMASYSHARFDLSLVKLRQTANGSVVYADFLLKNTTSRALRIAIKGRDPRQSSYHRAYAHIITPTAFKCLTYIKIFQASELRPAKAYV